MRTASIGRCVSKHGRERCVRVRGHKGEHHGRPRIVSASDAGFSFPVIEEEYAVWGPSRSARKRGR